MVSPAPRVRVLAASADADAARLGRLLGAPFGASAGALLLARPELVVVRGPEALLRRGAWAATLAGAAAVIGVPVGMAVALPWWERRFHRLLFATQAEARAWVEAGTSLGRVVVVERGDEASERAALAAIVEEVLSMAHRPSRDRRAGARHVSARAP